jgi:hypothetical protein
VLLVFTAFLDPAPDRRLLPRGERLVMIRSQASLLAGSPATIAA